MHIFLNNISFISFFHIDQKLASCEELLSPTKNSFLFFIADAKNPRQKSVFHFYTHTQMCLPFLFFSIYFFFVSLLLFWHVCETIPLLSNNFCKLQFAKQFSSKEWNFVVEGREVFAQTSDRVVIINNCFWNERGSVYYIYEEYTRQFRPMYFYKGMMKREKKRKCACRACLFECSCVIYCVICRSPIYIYIYRYVRENATDF